MKKAILVFSMASLLLAGSLKTGLAQEQPKPKKDTVNIDTDAKPIFYYAVEDKESTSKSGAGKIVIIAGVLVIGAVGGFVLLRKKKK